MNDIKLSLIICCYNVSSYLDDLYNLLCSQPYKNIEVVFVEDCSTDETKQKLNSIVLDGRMQVIYNDKNLGVSESRNVGMSFVTGDYIGFPDPDDMFDSNWLNEVAILITKYQPDVIVTGMREDYQYGTIDKYSKNIVSQFNGFIEKDFPEVLLDLEDTMLFGYMNNKMYKSEILLKNHIKCKTMALKEDYEFNIDFFRIIDNFYILNRPYYFYKKRIGAVTLTTKYVPEYFDIHKGSVNQFKGLLESYHELTDASKALLVNRFMRYFLSAIERNTDKKSLLTQSAQIEWIENQMTDDSNQWYFDNYHYLTGKLKMVSPFVEHKMSKSLLVIGKILRIVKNKSPILFSKIK